PRLLAEGPAGGGVPASGARPRRLRFLPPPRPHAAALRPQGLAFRPAGFRRKRLPPAAQLCDLQHIAAAAPRLHCFPSPPSIAIPMGAEAETRGPRPDRAVPPPTAPFRSRNLAAREITAMAIVTFEPPKSQASWLFPAALVAASAAAA